MTKRLLIMLLVWPLVASAQPETFDPASLSIDGHWTATYWDLHLGPVQGEVEVDELTGTVQISYRTVFDESTYVLTTSSISREGDTVILELEGRHPVRFIDDGRGYPKNDVVVPQEAGTLQVQVGAESAGLDIQPRADSDLDTLRLELTITGPTTLEGIGRFRADPFTRRDRRGGGRYSTYREDDDGTGWQETTEIWRRPDPEIFTTIVVPEQLTYAGGFSDLPNYPHRFQNNANRRDTDYRELAIIGRNLPSGPRYPAQFEAEGEEISFSFVRYGDRIARDPNGNDDLSRAQDKLLRTYPELVQAVGMDELEFVLVRADFTEGIFPGLHSFAMNGATDTWKLEFGDNRATVNWVRPVRPTSAGMDGRETEATHDLFLPEEVMIEVNTEVDLGVDTIWVLPGKNGQLMKMSARGPQIPAHKVEYPPNTFRTAPIRLVKEGSPAADSVYRAPPASEPVNPDPPDPAFYTIPIKPDDRLEAGLYDETSLISIKPEPAIAKVYAAPEDVNADWLVWLQTAASCHEDVTLTPGSAINHEAIEQFNERRLFFWDTLSTTVQLGDHAALMLLRETYMELMRARWSELTVDRDDLSLVAVRRSLEPNVLALHSALGDIVVQNENGEDIFFAETYNASNQGNRYKAGVVDVPQWVLDATRQALVQYGEMLQGSIDVAAEMDPCEDIQDMLELTGTGFEPVIQLLYPRLMQPGAAILPGALAPTLEPDYDARFRVWRIAQLAEQVETYEELSDEDTRLIFQAATIAFVPVGMWAGAIGPQFALWAQRIAWSVEAAEIAWDTYDQAMDFWDSWEELDFARASVDVLGYGRYERARARDISFTQLMTGFGIERSMDFIFNRLTDLGRDIATTVQQNRNFASRRRGLRKFQEGETMDRRAWANSLTDRDLVDINNYFENLARQRASRPINPVMSDYDMHTLNRGDALLNAQEVPDWVRVIGVEHNDYLQRIHRRADVQNLDGTEQIYLREQLNAPGRRGEEARNQLLYEPWRGTDDFNARVDRRMRREYEPLGQEGFDQAAPGHQAGREAVEEQGFEFEINADESGGPASITVRGPNDTADIMEVGFYPDDDLLELNFIGRENVPGNIGGNIPLRQNPNGFPSFTLGQMRYLHRMGVGYAGTGRQALREIKLENVVATRTNAQLVWYKNALYSDLSWQEFAQIPEISELLMNTRSLEYVRTLANLSGYRISRVRLQPQGPETEIGGLVSYHATGVDGDDFSATLRRYGLEHDSNGAPYFEIHVELEPHPAAFRARNASTPDTPTSPGPTPPPDPGVPSTPSSSTTARLPIELPPSARDNLRDAMDRYNDSVPAELQIDDATRDWVNDLVERQVRLGVSDEAAVGFVQRQLPRFGEAPNLDDALRADLLALAVIGDGNRQIRLEDFAEAAGVSPAMAEIVASRAAKNVGLTEIPGILSPARFYPDVGTVGF